MKGFMVNATLLERGSIDPGENLKLIDRIQEQIDYMRDYWDQIFDEQSGRCVVFNG